MLISLILPVYMSNKFLVPMFMTNMLIVQKLHTIYNLFIYSFIHNIRNPHIDTRIHLKTLVDNTFDLLEKQN